MSQDTKFSVLVFCAFVAWAAPAGPAHAQSPAPSPNKAEMSPTLKKVTARGELLCGINGNLPGFSAKSKTGGFAGLDVDYCRALASAIFGDADKVGFVTLTAAERFQALIDGTVDVVSRNTTMTFTRDVALKTEFVGIMLYDGQGVLVPKRLGIKSVDALNGAGICLIKGTTTEKNLADYFRSLLMTFKAVTFDTHDAAVAAYAAGQCDALSADRSGLAALRSGLEDPSGHVILPEILSKEPLGPLVRQDDPAWLEIARWTYFTLLLGEELDISTKTVNKRLQSDDPEVLRLLGREGSLGASLGLRADWAYQILGQVGHYGEVFNRHLGTGSPIGLARGLNALYRDGGLMYAPPIR